MVPSSRLVVLARPHRAPLGGLGGLGRRGESAYTAHDDERLSRGRFKNVARPLPCPVLILPSVQLPVASRPTRGNPHRRDVFLALEQLERVRMADFAAIWRDVGDDFLSAVARVGESGWVVLGTEVAAFEEELADFWGVAHAIGVASGLDAIEICLRIVGLRPGDEVLTTPLTAFATTLAIVRAGGIPVYCDVDSNGLIDLDRAEAVLQTRPQIRAFLPVHLYGQVVDLDRLDAISQRYDITIVEDCAQSVGAKFGIRTAGTVGSASATSLYPTKNLGAFGDGGVVLTNDAALADAARTLRDYGQSAKYVHSVLGLNSRLDELHAATLRTAMLPRLPGYQRRRAEVAAAYTARIRTSAITFLLPRAGTVPAWHLFPVLVNGRTEHFVAHLATQGVETARHYPFVCPDQPALQNIPHVVADPLDQGRRFASQVVSLPLHPFLTDTDVTTVIQACNSFAPSD